MSDLLKDDVTESAVNKNKISHVVGIMSGKGGVGKSLVTGLMATALRKAGYNVGIMDADITGPSIPKMFGIKTKPGFTRSGILPVESSTGVKIISINLFLESPEDAVIWRGPMVSNAVKQFWTDVNWGTLDYLLVDMPPGTSDVPLTIFQSIPINYAVIVTSPQDLAALVVKKAINMCTTMNVDIFGIVQNMAYIKCPSCSQIIYPFGQSDGDELSEKMGVPHMFDIPLDPEISRLVDAGLIETYFENPFIGVSFDF